MSPGRRLHRGIHPPTPIPSTVKPNIRRPVPPHSECWRQEWDHGSFGRPGDVRRCPWHGRVQVLTQVPINARTQGPGTHWWRDLSAFWNPIEYRRAVRALEGG